MQLPKSSHQRAYVCAKQSEKKDTGMAEPKTKPTGADVYAFIQSFAPSEQRKQDSLALLKIMEAATGEPPKMWGPSIIGFGTYHYKSERSTQEGDWPLLGFSPRKAAISLYVYTGSQEHAHLLKDLGKFKMGKACIYVNRLSDINPEALDRLMKATLLFMRTHYPVKQHPNKG